MRYLHRLRPPWIGRRGASLLFFALVFGVSAWSYLAHPELITANPNRELINRLATPQEWGILFATASFTKLVVAFWRKFEVVAFGLGTTIWFVWGGSYLISWLQTHPHFGALGTARALASVLYLALGAFNLILAGWPEERNRR